MNLGGEEKVDENEINGQVLRVEPVGGGTTASDCRCCFFFLVIVPALGLMILPIPSPVFKSID